MNTPEFIDAVMARLELPSDRKFGEALDIPNGQVSLYRNGKRTLSPGDCRKVAKALNVPPAYVLALVQAERAKRTEDRRDWEWLAELAKKSQAAALLILVGCSGYLTMVSDAVEAARQCILCKIRRVRVLAVLAVATLATGCSSMPRSEVVWQSLHVLDAAQTYNLVDDPCYHEDSWPTQQLIGRNPSHESVAAWAVGVSIAHYALNRWLENSDVPPAWQRGLRAVDLAYKAYVVSNNHAIGVRPWGSNRPCH